MTLEIDRFCTLRPIMVLLHKHQLGEKKNAQKDFIYEIISPKNVTQRPEDSLLEQWVYDTTKGHFLLPLDFLYECRTILVLDTSLQKHSYIAITLRRAQFLHMLLVK